MSTPDIPTAKAVAKALLEAKESQESVVNLSREMAESYKKIFALMGGITKQADLQKTFSNEILKDSQAREIIESRLGRNISMKHDLILEAKTREIQLNTEQAIIEDARANQEKINDTLKSSGKREERRKEMLYIKKEHEERERNLAYLSGKEKEEASTRLRENRAVLNDYFSKYKRNAEFEGANGEKFSEFIKKQKEDYLEIERTRESSANTSKEILDTEKNNFELRNGNLTLMEAEMLLDKALLARLKYKNTMLTAYNSGLSRTLGPLSSMVQFSVAVGQAFSKDPLKRLEASVTVIQAGFSGISKIVEVTVARFKELEETAERFRKETGFTINQSKKLKDYITEMSAKYAHMGLSAEEFTKSEKALSEVFNDLNMVNEDTLLTTTKLAVNLNVAQEDTAKILTTFMGISGVTEKTAMTIMKNAAGLFKTKETGISFSAVMKDVANASDDVLTSIGASPGKLIKAAAAARMMGLELNKVGAQQKRLLDYSSSITDELEASALLGRNITFMKARQLAFEGKSEESMRETLDVVRQMGNFNAMTPYQRAAVAKAAGMELKDLTKALAVDHARVSILNGTDKKKRDQLLAQDKLLKSLEKENDLTDEQLLNEQQQAINQQQILGLTTQINNAFKSIAAIFSQTFGPTLEVLATTLTKIAGVLAESPDSVKKLTAGLGVLISTALAVVPAFYSWRLIKTIINDIGGTLQSVLAKSAKKGIESVVEVAAEGANNTKKTLTRSALQRGWEAGPVIDFRRQKQVTQAATEMSKGPIQDVAKSKAGEGFSTFMSNLGKGFGELAKPQAMLGIAVGIASIAAFAGVMYLWSKIDWGNAAIGIPVLAGLAVVAGLMGKFAPFIELGAFAIGSLGIALIPFGAAMVLVAVSTKIFAEGLNIAKDSLVQILEKAEPSKILAFGAALTAMTFALAAAAPFAALAGSGLLIMTAGLLAFGLAMTMMGNSAEKFGKGIKQGVDSLQSLSTINFISLFANVNKLGTQLKSSTGTFKEFVAGVFGNDTITKVEKLSKMSQDITPTAAAIATMVASFQEFNVVNSFANAIDKLATSFVSLNTAVAALDTNKLGDVAKSTSTTSTTASTPQASNTPNTQFDTTKLEAKIDELAKALYDRPIQLYLDSKQISSGTAKASGS